MEKAKNTLIRLILGIVIYAVIVGIVGVLFVDNKITFILGLAYGTMGAIAVSMHLYFSLNKSLDMDTNTAEKREKKMAVIRMIIMIAVTVIGFCFPGIFHIAGVLLGLFGLKVSAYLQPLFHNYTLKDKGR